MSHNPKRILPIILLLVVVNLAVMPVTGTPDQEGAPAAPGVVDGTGGNQTANASEIEIAWKAAPDTPPIAAFRAVAATSDGGVVAIGNAGWLVDSRYENLTSILMKVDSTGDIQWVASYDSAFDDNQWYRPRAVTQVDSGFVIGGRLLSGNRTTTGGSGIDPRSARTEVLLTDKQGTTESSQTYRDTTIRSINDVIPDPDGGYVLVGTNHPDSMREDGQRADPQSRAAIVKATHDGTVEWNHSFSTSLSPDRPAEEHHALDVVQTSDGGYVVVGRADGDASGAEKFPDSVAWAMKIDASGTIEWNRTYGSTSQSDEYRGSVRKTAEAIVRMGDNDYVVFGMNGSETHLFGIDDDGTRQWTKSTGDRVYSSQFRNMDRTPGNTLVVTKYEDGRQLRHYDREGNLIDIWSVTFPEYIQGSFSIATMDGGGVAIAQGLLDSAHLDESADRGAAVMKTEPLAGATPTLSPTPSTTSDSGAPGFTAFATLGALLGALIVLWRLD